MEHITNFLTHDEEVYLLHYYMVNNYHAINDFLDAQSQVNRDGLTKKAREVLKKIMLEIIHDEYAIENDLAEQIVEEMLESFYEEISEHGTCNHCDKAIVESDSVCYLANDSLVHEKCVDAYLREAFIKEIKTVQKESE